MKQNPTPNFSSYAGILREVTLPPILTNRECLDSTITCRTCRGRGCVYIRNPINKSCTLQYCPACRGTREIKSTSTEDYENLQKEIKDYGYTKK